MLFFGMIWVTSWFGAAWSFNQILQPSAPSKVLQKKVTSNFQNSASEVLPSYLNFWSATILPSRFLKIDWKDNQEATNSSGSALIYSGKKNDRYRAKLCSSPQGLFAKSPQVHTKASFSPSLQLIESTFVQQDFLSAKVLRLHAQSLGLSSSVWLRQTLQNFFRFTGTSKDNLKPISSAVVVVRRGKEKYEVWLKNHLIANLPNKLQANLMQRRLKGLLESSHVNASKIRPAFIDGIPALMAGNRFLFSVDKEISQKNPRSPDLLAIEWVNNLRSALKAPKLSLLEGQVKMHGLKPSGEKFSGFASWYGPYFHGRLTANGERYNQNELTVAHKTLPFNTFLQVTNTQTGKSVIVRVNDRGPYIPPRSLDLSRTAARCIQSEKAGVVPYKAVIMKPTQPQLTLKKSTRIQKDSKKLVTTSKF